MRNKLLFEWKVFQWKCRTKLANWDRKLNHKMAQWQMAQNGVLLENTAFRKRWFEAHKAPYRLRSNSVQGPRVFQRGPLSSFTYRPPFNISWPGTATLLGLNGAVFLGWKLATPPKHPLDLRHSRTASRGLSLSTVTMQKHFTTSWYALSNGYWYTPLTATVSHRDNKHFLYNMVTGFFMGRSLEALIGARKLLFVYFVGQTIHVSGGLAAVVQAFSERKKRPWISIYGASGAVAAVMAILALRIPFSLIYLYGLVPVPMLFLVGGCLAYDLLSFGALDGIGHEAHVAGTFVGAALHFVLQR